MSRFEKDSILSGLKQKIIDKKMIFASSAGMGLEVKAADEAGVDFIISHKEELFAADGRVGAFARAGYGEDCNIMMMEIGPKLLKVCKSTPMIVGIGVAEPYTNIDRMTERFLEMGFSGLANLPTSGGWVGNYGDGISAAGVGFSAELEYITRWSKKGVLTVGYCFTEEQAAQMAAAGASIVSVYVPKTKNESHGWKAAESMEQAIETARKLCEKAKSENSEAIVLCSGGTLLNAADIKRCVTTAGAYGYIGDDHILGASIESGIITKIQDYKSMPLSMEGKS